jgi:hypothetical protein
MIYKYLIIGVIVCGVVWAIDDFGYERASNEWQVKWDKQVKQIDDAKLAHEKELRELQIQLNNVNQVCLPSCLENLSSEINSWQSRLTDTGLPD